MSARWGKLGSMKTWMIVLGVALHLASPIFAFLGAYLGHRLAAKKRTDAFNLYLFQKRVEAYEKICLAAEEYGSKVFLAHLADDLVSKEELKELQNRLRLVYVQSRPYCDGEVSQKVVSLVSTADNLTRSRDTEDINPLLQAHRELTNAIRDVLDVKRLTEEMSSLLPSENQSKIAALLLPKRTD